MGELCQMSTAHFANPADLCHGNRSCPNNIYFMNLAEQAERCDEKVNREARRCRTLRLLEVAVLHDVSLHTLSRRTGPRDCEQAEHAMSYHQSTACEFSRFVMSCLGSS